LDLGRRRKEVEEQKRGKWQKGGEEKMEQTCIKARFPQVRDQL
jgi:hypothetical protein